MTSLKRFVAPSLVPAATLVELTLDIPICSPTCQ